MESTRVVSTDSDFYAVTKSILKKAVEEAVNERSIKDLNRGEKITIPQQDIHEPSFGHGQGGTGSIVHPGNKEFNTGDRIPKPPGGGGQGSGSGDASDQGEGEDDFVFKSPKKSFSIMYLRILSSLIFCKKN